MAWSIQNWKVLTKNIYKVRRLETNKTQLLQLLRLTKFTQQAPLADFSVRETDWEKIDQISIAHVQS